MAELVESTSLLTRHAAKRIGGSNPSPSAKTRQGSVLATLRTRVTVRGKRVRVVSKQCVREELIDMLTYKRRLRGRVGCASNWKMKGPTPATAMTLRRHQDGNLATPDALYKSPISSTAEPRPLAQSLGSRDGGSTPPSGTMLYSYYLIVSS